MRKNLKVVVCLAVAWIAGFHAGAGCVASGPEAASDVAFAPYVDPGGHRAA